MIPMTAKAPTPMTTPRIMASFLSVEASLLLLCGLAPVLESVAWGTTEVVAVGEVFWFVDREDECVEECIMYVEEPMTRVVGTEGRAVRVVDGYAEDSRESATLQSDSGTSLDVDAAAVVDASIASVVETPLD